MPRSTRRRFLEESLLATAAAAAAPRLLSAQETREVGANDQITAAIIGCGIRGKQHARELARQKDCRIAYVCDPDRDRAEEVAADLVGLGRPKPKAVQDLRTALDDKAVDVVFIAAPNHWHALAAIWAMRADKDVYVEKPVSHNVREGRRIVEEARKRGRICQGGTQNRSNGALAAAVAHMREGKLGEVKLARAIVHGRRGSIGGPGPCAMPPNLDFNLWAGPSPLVPPSRPKLHYDWHWFWDTGNGELGNNNIHYLDVCRWGLGVNGLGRAVVSYGGRLGYQDAGQTPNTQVVVYDFGDRTIISETRGLKTEPFHPNFEQGWIFFGTEGIIAGTSLFDPDGKLIRPFEGRGENHFANFLKAVRSRNVSDLNADILEGHQSTALCHLGNISYRLGAPAAPEAIERELDQLPSRDLALETFDRTRQHLADNDIDLTKTPVTLGAALRLDPHKEAFQDNPRADALLTREYRSPFVVPDADKA